MKTRHAIAAVASTASALALVPVAQAYAHDSGSAPTRPSLAGPAITDRARLAGLSGLALDKLDAWSAKLQASAAAVPSGTALTGTARAMARKQLAAAVGTYARLGSLDGLTADQQARVALIQARLAAAAASLRALLANAPALPVKVVPTTTTSPAKVAATDTARHHCDGDWSRVGDRDGYRWHHHDGFRRR